MKRKKMDEPFRVCYPRENQSLFAHVRSFTCTNSNNFPNKNTNNAVVGQGSTLLRRGKLPNNGTNGTQTLRRCTPHMRHKTVGQKQMGCLGAGGLRGHFLMPGPVRCEREQH